MPGANSSLPGTQGSLDAAEDEALVWPEMVSLTASEARLLNEGFIATNSGLALALMGLGYFSPWPGGCFNIFYVVKDMLHHRSCISIYSRSNN